MKIVDSDLLTISLIPNGCQYIEVDLYMQNKMESFEFGAPYFIFLNISSKPLF